MGTFQRWDIELAVALAERGIDADKIPERLWELIDVPHDATPDQAADAMVRLIADVVRAKFGGKRKPKAVIDRVRWYHARRLLDTRMSTRDDVFEHVSDQLKGRIGQGAPETIRRSYERVEQSLPASERFRRTYNRWHKA